MAWCHGAPGIGLARLSSLSDGDEITRMEIKSALYTTVAAGAGHTHCLCHGDPGNLDLLIEAVRRPLWARRRSEVDRLAAVVLIDIEHYGWRCGLALDVQSPGLMTGVAGIGYQWVRLADPERVPSVLVFGHPVARKEEIAGFIVGAIRRLLRACPRLRRGARAIPTRGSGDTSPELPFAASDPASPRNLRQAAVRLLCISAVQPGWRRAGFRRGTVAKSSGCFLRSNSKASCARGSLSVNVPCEI